MEVAVVRAVAVTASAVQVAKAVPAVAVRSDAGILS